MALQTFTVGFVIIILSLADFGGTFHLIIAFYVLIFFESFL